MARVGVTNTDLGNLSGNLRGIAQSTPRRLSGVVRNAIKRGNRNAANFAREDHTMHSDIDIEYPESFTAEMRGKLAGEYGPEDSGEGSKAPGYEHGSVNQASAHRNLDRAVDLDRIEFPLDVSDEMRLIWQEAGF